jgi:hypothetical protein
MRASIALPLSSLPPGFFILPITPMGIASALALFVSKKPESPWEVVDSRHVEPVAVFDEDDGAWSTRVVRSTPKVTQHCILSTDLDLIYIHETEIVRTYVFDVRKDQDFHNSLCFAQQQLLREVQTKGYNLLWTEG